MQAKELEWTYLDYHPSWDVTDSTKINAYLECPRKYFYEYVLGWRQDTSKHDLEFGEAWHQAMEFLLNNGYDSDAVAGAYDAFMKHYRQHFSEETDDQYAPKNPFNAFRALCAYTVQYADDLSKYRTIYTEVAGSVPVMENKNIHFRIDAIMQDASTDEYFCLEHKTTKRGGRTWVDQWALSIQCGTYAHALYCLYGPEKVYGVRVNGAIFKKDLEFQRVPVKKTLGSMNVWHATVCHVLMAIERDFKTLSITKPTDRVMEAFPLNPTACTKYWGCPYHDFCTCWNNPVAKCSDIPDGFVIDRWDPSDREAKFVVDVSESAVVTKKGKGE